MKNRFTGTIWIGYCVACALTLSFSESPAQQPSTSAAKPLPKIGVLSAMGGGRASPEPTLEKELERLGWVNGSTATIERAIGPLDQLPRLAAELVQAKPDVIIALTASAAVALKETKVLVPTVVYAAHDGVAIGLFQSLARPGGMFTGTESLGPLLDEKRTELIRMLVPGLRKLAIIHNPLSPNTAPHLKSSQAVAQRMGIHLALVPVKSQADYPSAFEKLWDADIDAALMYSDEVTIWMGVFPYERKRKLPMVCEFAFQVVLQGCLVSYGPLLSEFAKTTARQVDEILRGADPATMPVQLMTRFELALNRRTAADLGISISPEFLMRVDVLAE